MKRILLLITANLFVLYINAQTLQEVTDNGSITTKNISVGGISTIGYLILSTSWINYGDANGASANDFGVYNTYLNSDALVIRKETNNVGIGTTLPIAKLDVNGGIAINSGINNTSVRPQILPMKIPGEIRAYSGNGSLFDDGFLRLSAGAGTNASVMSFIDLTGYSTVPDMDQNIRLGTAGLERFRIISNGNVGIGTTTPREKLSVNGKIRAQEIKVETANWPDYVFEDNYQPSSLTDLETYIKTNKHLPEIPSAREVEENGVSLGEMNVKLLKKIEELTLQLIEKDKELKQQKDINQTQEKRLLIIENKLNQL